MIKNKAKMTSIKRKISFKNKIKINLKPIKMWKKVNCKKC